MSEEGEANKPTVTKIEEISEQEEGSELFGLEEDQISLGSLTRAQIPPNFESETKRIKYKNQKYSLQ